MQRVGGQVADRHAQRLDAQRVAAAARTAHDAVSARRPLGPLLRERRHLQVAREPPLRSGEARRRLASAAGPVGSFHAGRQAAAQLSRPLPGAGGARALARAAEAELLRAEREQRPVAAVPGEHLVDLLGAARYERLLVGELVVAHGREERGGVRREMQALEERQQLLVLLWRERLRREQQHLARCAPARGRGLDAPLRARRRARGRRNDDRTTRHCRLQRGRWPC